MVEFFFASILNILTYLHFKLPDANASHFPVAVLKKAMFDTIHTLNRFAHDAGITEVCKRVYVREFPLLTYLKPSLMNFCVTDGETVVATRYISSKVHEAASLVCFFALFIYLLTSELSVVLVRNLFLRICDRWLL